MKIFSVQNILPQYTAYKPYSCNQTQTAQLNGISADYFEKKSVNTSLHRNVQFLGSIVNINNEFEMKFTKTFFKKLLREGITDGYSDIILIPRENYDELKKYGDLNKKSIIAIKALKKYRDNMFPVEKEIFSMLETMSKKNPDLTLQELIRLKYPQAEQSLILQQSKILNKINITIRKLPKNDYQKVRAVIQNAFDKIFEPNPKPEKRFGRKKFLNDLRNIELKDKKTKKQILKIAEKLPSSSNNINAFIVKYSQPYKIRYDYNKHKNIYIKRDSQELGLRLIEPSIGTDDHIYPHTRFRKEFQEWLENDNDQPLKNNLKVTILTSRNMNGLKTDTLIDDFILENESLNIPEKIQNHVKRLIEIAERWTKVGRLEDASLLCDYIQVVKQEFDLRSNIIKIDLREFETKIPKIQERAATSCEKKAEKKRLKKAGHADNTHKETYLDKNKNPVENRKVQKHQSRFKK